MYRFLIPLLLFSTQLFGQRSNDISYIPSDNSLIVSQNAGNVGVYIGGRYYTSYPYPYTYYSPFSIMNRFGAQLRITKDINLMFGVHSENFGFSTPPGPLEPELWIKVGLFNTLTQEINPYDLVLSLKVSREINYGVGIFVQW